MFVASVWCSVCVWVSMKAQIRVYGVVFEYDPIGLKVSAK